MERRWEPRFDERSLEDALRAVKELDERVQQMIIESATLEVETRLMQIRESESPIEQMMAIALSDVVRAVREWYGDIYIRLMPQHLLKVEGKSYRVDFLLTCVVNERSLQVAIECDGHDYHERTKEQAARDRSRDRDLQAQGFHVFRFTGSEIWRNPYACANEVWTLLQRFIEHGR